MLIRNRLIGLFILFLGFQVGVLAQKSKGPHHYLLFKVSDLSIDEDRERIADFLSENYGLNSEIEAFSLDFPSLAYRLADGWNFTKYMGLEAELIYYDEYDVNITTTDDETFRINRKSYAAGLSLLGRYPIMKKFEAYGKAGFSYWRTDSKRRGGPEDIAIKIHEDKIQATFGAGLRYFLGENLVADLSLEKTEVDGLDVDTISIGFGFRY